MVTDYELLYDLPSGEYEAKGVPGIRTVTIRAGRSLEIMCHPIGKLSADARREAKERRTKPAMELLNHRNRERHMMRLIEFNFTAAAQVVTLTYDYPTEDYGLASLNDLQAVYTAHDLPEEKADVNRHLRSFRARLATAIRRAGGDPRRMKWLFRIEQGKEPPVGGLPPRFHVHGLIECDGLTRQMIDDAWPRGYTRAEALDTRNDGPMRLARYINKTRARGRWWSHSRNLRTPAPRVSDRKISRRRVALMAEDVRRNGREILEKLYPGYKLVELPEIRYSDFCPGVYIYARMRKRD